MKRRVHLSFDFPKNVTFAAGMVDITTRIEKAFMVSHQKYAHTCACYIFDRRGVDSGTTRRGVDGPKAKVSSIPSTSTGPVVAMMKLMMRHHRVFANAPPPRDRLKARPTGHCLSPLGHVAAFPREQTSLKAVTARD
uniref:PID domain-containing protein n=1 Tax=Panagrellus redivivus TaxID=6233 RepID=A0A7E4VFM3_PANRE